MTALERMCEAYWEAFRQGYFKVGGRPEDYPTWANAPAAIKEETRRCMRHAAQAVVDSLKVKGTAHKAVSGLFPERLAKRGQPLIDNDTAFVQQTKLAENLG